MKYRQLGRTGWKVSEISFGAWAIGGLWGKVSDEDAMKTLHKAIECGVNFIDTADAYGDGRSERLIAQLKQERVGIRARGPLDSGMMTGKLRRDSSVPDGDDRDVNRHGEMFDVGETFSGVDYAWRLDAVEEVRRLRPAGVSMSQFAVRWIV